MLAPTTRPLAFASACACLLALGACKRYEDVRRGTPLKQPVGSASPAEPPSAVPPASAAPETSIVPPPGTNPPNCPPGYTANTYPAWCIKLPKGFSPSKVQVDGRNMGHVDYSPSSAETLTVFFTDAPMQQVADQAWGVFNKMNWEQTGSGDLDKGRKWLEGHDLEGRGHFVVVAPGRAPFTLKCETTATPDTERYRRDAETCKTLFVP